MLLSLSRTGTVLLEWRSHTTAVVDSWYRDPTTGLSGSVSHARTAVLGLPAVLTLGRGHLLPESSGVSVSARLRHHSEAAISHLAKTGSAGI